MNSPGAEFTKFKTILLRLENSKASTEEFELILNTMSFKDDSSRKSLVLKYLSNLVNMNKTQFVASVTQLQEIFGEKYPIKDSVMIRTAIQDPKDIGEKVLRNLAFGIKAVISLSKSGDYCLKCLDSGITNNIINELMLEEKKVENFGIQMDDLKSLKSALNIYERLKLVFEDELLKDKKQELVELLISELLEFQKRFEQEKTDPSNKQKFSEFLELVSKKDTQIKINNLISERQDTLKDATLVLGSFFLDSVIAFRIKEDFSYDLSVTIHYKEGDEAKQRTYDQN